MMRMLRVFFCAILLLGVGAAVHAQAAVPQTILLWPDGAPGALGKEDIDKPSLIVFPTNGAEKVPTAVIICPGGSYGHLSMEKEGSDVAKWLNERGITAFVLKYRLGPKYHHPIEIGDAQRAIRYARLHAKDYGYDEKRIGIWGFSAGGHLASTAGTHFDSGKVDASDPIDRQSSRPDFMILAYPVITFTMPYLHQGSRDNLLGKDPDPALIELLSNEKHVTADTPPTFLFHTTDDKTVPVENSVYFYLALRKAGVRAEIHIYEKGSHGLGLAPGDPVVKSWVDRLADWLNVEGLR
jgi:acetyl esterase/lipase